MLDAAADQRSAFLRDFATGPHGPLSQTLLDRLGAARACLADPAKREAYDRTLRSDTPPPAATPAPVRSTPDRPPLSRPVLIASGFGIVALLAGSWGAVLWAAGLWPAAAAEEGTPARSEGAEPSTAPPRPTLFPSVTATAGGELVLNLPAGPAGTRYELAGPPPPGLTLEATRGRLRWAVPPDAGGKTWRVPVRLRSAPPGGAGGPRGGTELTFTATHPPRLPELRGDPVRRVPAGEPFVVELLARDPASPNTPVKIEPAAPLPPGLHLEPRRLTSTAGIMEPTAVWLRLVGSGGVAERGVFLWPEGGRSSVDAAADVGAKGVAEADALENSAPPSRAVEVVRPAAVPMKVRTGEITPRKLRGHRGHINDVAVTPDGDCIVSGSDDRTIRVWDIVTGQAVRTLGRQREAVLSIQVASEGGRIISTAPDHTLWVWQTDEERPLHVLEGHAEEINSVAMTPDAGLIVSASLDGTARVWDTNAGRAIHLFSEMGDWKNSVVIAPDGSFAAGASLNRSDRASGVRVKTWDLKTGDVVHTRSGIPGRIDVLLLTPDGRHVFGGSKEGSIELWNPWTGQVKQGFWDSGGSYAGWLGGSSIVLSPDQTKVVIRRDGNSLQIWDLAAGRLEQVIRCRPQSETGFAVTPDNRYVITGEQNTLRIWDIGTGEGVQTLTGRDELDGSSFDLRGLAVTPDGRYVVSGGAGREDAVFVWDVFEPDSTSQPPIGGASPLEAAPPVGDG